MLGELDVLGVFVSPLFLYVVTAGVFQILFKKIMVRWDLYRWVWHRPLFDVALFGILLGSVVAISRVLPLA